MERAVVNKHDIKPENIKETFAYLIDLKFFKLIYGKRHHKLD